MKEMACAIASEVRCLANCHLRLCQTGSKRQKGAVAVMFAGSLVAIIGFFGLALDLSRIYNRRVEMQGVADTIALAAVQKLNGQLSGVTNARDAARNIMQDIYYRPKFNYTQTMDWVDAAITFGRLVNGGTVWLSLEEANAFPGELIAVKVDTTALNSVYGQVNMIFMPVVSSSLISVSVGHAAIARRSRLNVTPLAICAMDPQRQAPRTNPAGLVELVEHGFRRGVSYDLMNLNPSGRTPANFLVDPIAKPGNGSSASNFAPITVGPYVCAGTVALSKVSGASVNVLSGFPLSLLFNRLNSRFGLYNADLDNGKCDPSAAPPDTNIKQYTAATIGWMNPKPTLQRAKPSSADPTRLQTIADLPLPNNQPPGDYGPLWANARAVPWQSAGQTEAPSGYAPFAATQAIWSALYATGPHFLGSYPAATPYSTASFSQLPSVNGPGIKNRRVLNIPLLACPVAGAVATVVAIGKFFMTVPADANIISAEFAGLASEQQLGGPVEITQ